MFSIILGFLLSFLSPAHSSNCNNNNSEQVTTLGDPGGDTGGETGTIPPRKP